MDSSILKNCLQHSRFKKHGLQRTRSLSTFGLLCRLSVHITSASAEPTANCALASHALQQAGGQAKTLSDSLGAQHCVGSTSKGAVWQQKHGSP